MNCFLTCSHHKSSQVSEMIEKSFVDLFAMTSIQGEDNTTVHFNGAGFEFLDVVFVLLKASELINSLETNVGNVQNFVQEHFSKLLH